MKPVAAAQLVLCALALTMPVRAQEMTVGPLMRAVHKEASRLVADVPARH